MSSSISALGAGEGRGVAFSRPLTVTGSLSSPIGVRRFSELGVAEDLSGVGEDRVRSATPRATERWRPPTFDLGEVDFVDSETGW